MIELFQLCEFGLTVSAESLSDGARTGVLAFQSAKAKIDAEKDDV